MAQEKLNTLINQGNNNILKTFSVKEIANIYKNSLNPSYQEKQTPPNFKAQIEEQGANTQMTTLANSLPQIDIKNKEIEEKFNKFAENYSLLETYQNLEYQLYKKGILALGFFHSVPVLGEVLEFKKDFTGKLTYLLLRVEMEALSMYELTEDLLEYDLKNDYVRQLTRYTNFNKTTITDKQTQDPEHYHQEILSGFIPFVIFKNRSDGKADIDLINNEYWDIINNKLTQLQLDAFYSTPLPVIYGVEGSAQSVSLTKALFSLSHGRIFTYKLTNDNGGIPLDLQTAPTQSQAIIASIESAVFWVKKFLFMKMDSQDGGTHNMHTAEVQQLNSDFEDYIETKANLREIYYKQFVNLALKVLNISEDDEDINVTVVGSTRWAIQNAQTLKTDQNGVLLNSQAISNKEQFADKNEETNVE
ncbi:hypothetical protein [Mycoplasmopsis sturni]|uniref:hypothetical protein n=1 Tax=Mycoplasmopsis sturni TaxID=39047 RepID=UPI000563EC4C|nr:hypothetical protein [Mycoplasmopsis sturni]